MTKYSSSRRRFLQASALFSASLVAPIAFNRIARAQDEVIDAVVIGSGFGGAVSALRLGQAGIQTLVLERGRRWTLDRNNKDPNVFTTFRNPDHRAAWFSDTTVIGDAGIDILKDGRQFAGVLELKQEDGIGAYCGAGVGGGSLVYNCAHYQPAREQFYLSLPQEIDYDEMDEIYYPLVRSIIDSSNIPTDVLNTEFYLQTRVFREQADKARLSNRFVEMAVDWDLIREEIAGKRVRSGIIGEHWIGMNSGAKNSLDQNYLPQAEATGKVDILPLHEVTEIEEINDPTGSTRYRVTCNQIEEFSDTGKNKIVVTTKSFVCKYLFLAAGSMGTSKILVKAKAKGKLTNLNDDIGKYWGNNGDSFAVRSNLGVITNSDQGGPINGAIIEHFNNPLGPVSLMGYPLWNAQEETLLSLGMSVAKPAGVFKYDPATDSVKLTWPENVQSNSVNSSNPELLDVVNLTYKILDKRNAYYGRMPKTEVMPGCSPFKRRGRFSRRKIRARRREFFAWRRERRAQIEENLPKPTFGNTAHPLGGAVLGKACDFYGRLENYQGLYVMDGALIAGSTGCANPAFTIAALAERNIEQILDRDIS